MGTTNLGYELNKLLFFILPCLKVYQYVKETSLRTIMSTINLWLVPVSNVPGHQSMAAEMLATAAATKSASEDFHIPSEHASSGPWNL